MEAEDIIVVIICLLFMLFMLVITIKLIIIMPICRYYIEKEDNLIQWRAIETESSLKCRPRDSYHWFDLYYRILPSELNTFVRIFGSNGWEIHFGDVKLENKEEFVNFISKHKTLADIKDDDRLCWTYP